MVRCLRVNQEEFWLGRAYSELLVFRCQFEQGENESTWGSVD